MSEIVRKLFSTHRGKVDKKQTNFAVCQRWEKTCTVLPQKLYENVKDMPSNKLIIQASLYWMNTIYIAK